MSTKSISAYIHIPFCEHICYYCDFNKVFIEGQPVDTYLKMLDLEMQLWLDRYKDIKIPTIYIGGGTPTSLSAEQLEYLLERIQQRIDLSQVEEFTVEANPGDLTEEKLWVLQKYGVNRLSMGVQTFNNRLLKKIGRKHTAEDVEETLNFLAKNDFNNVSIDLIYALPGQTLADFEETLKKALSYQLPHYSMYSLILENKTMFMNWVRKGNLTLPTQDEEAMMFQLAIDTMKQAGYDQYEVSNFAKPNFYSKHNLVYWNNEHYFGWGAGASGYVDDLRYRNYGPIQHYLKPLQAGNLPILSEEKLTVKEQMEEEMFLGLRKSAGVDIQKFEKKFQTKFVDVYGSVLTELVANGYVRYNEGEFIQLTQKGLFVGNDVFEKFLID
ncbi:radical SAM family heme chaperone HemW [Enterococcus columbae]|uniref:Heme chaperone HemW n=1 Tax=Enterococcus columbae DSM 7374 = ATCC 51263 TaxID=1121865 RepID=S1NPQ4_9ENTE|nr:radical SAM family heme chaperone HemW [Enterococcus columbae]EOT42855.1 coproporphyrinogen III oxidase [Enterococcus columbae DSM 7374 = ATCC 51263]EOW87708.1 coproporphyrinogen III oxidase [Enterococcus columbae DSM 7374 = ATCC 51263]